MTLLKYWAKCESHPPGCTLSRSPLRLDQQVVNPSYWSRFSLTLTLCRSRSAPLLSSLYVYHPFIPSHLWFSVFPRARVPSSLACFLGHDDICQIKSLSHDNATLHRCYRSNTKDKKVTYLVLVCFFLQWNRQSAIPVTQGTEWVLQEPIHPLRLSWLATIDCRLCWSPTCCGKGRKDNQVKPNQLLNEMFMLDSRPEGCRPSWKRCQPEHKGWRHLLADRSRTEPERRSIERTTTMEGAITGWGEKTNKQAILVTERTRTHTK